MNQFTRIKNDINGNPRYVVHFLKLLTPSEAEGAINTRFYETFGINAVSKLYELAVKRANKIGGRKYHTRAYGGGIVFQSYSLKDLEEHINRVVREAKEKEGGEG